MAGKQLRPTGTVMASEKEVSPVTETSKQGVPAFNAYSENQNDELRDLDRIDALAKAPSQWASERDIINKGKQRGDVGIEKREDQLQAAMSIGASDFKQNVGKALNKVGIMKDEGYDALKDSVNDQQHTVLSEYETKYYPNSEWSQKDKRYQKGVYSPDYQKQQPDGVTTLESDVHKQRVAASSELMDKISVPTTGMEYEL